MKIAPARVAAFLQRPDPDIRAVLLYGPDAGLVRERADHLARTVCADLADPFRVADLNGAALVADPARLADKSAATQPDRRSAGCAGTRCKRWLGTIFAGYLAEMPGEALVVAEAAELSSGSALRRAFDGSPHGAAIGCYPDAPRDRAAVIRESLAAHHVSASRDATQYLVDHLGEDRLVTRSELDKLALYVGDGGRVELEDAVLVGRRQCRVRSRRCDYGGGRRRHHPIGTRPRPRIPGRQVPGYDCPRDVAPSSPASCDGGERKRRRDCRRGDARRTSTDLFQTPGRVPAPALAMARAAPARGARSSLASRNRNEDNGSSCRNVVPRSIISGRATGAAKARQPTVNHPKSPSAEYIFSD